MLYSAFVGLAKAILYLFKEASSGRQAVAGIIVTPRFCLTRQQNLHLIHETRVSRD